MWWNCCFGQKYFLWRIPGRTCNKYCNPKNVLRSLGVTKSREKCVCRPLCVSSDGLIDSSSLQETNKEANDNYEMIRGPRPWEDSNTQLQNMKQQRVEERKKKRKILIVPTWSKSWRSLKGTLRYIEENRCNVRWYTGCQHAWPFLVCCDKLFSGRTALTKIRVWIRCTSCFVRGDVQAINWVCWGCFWTLCSEHSLGGFVFTVALAPK